MSYTELLELARQLILDIWATPWVKILVAQIVINFAVAVFAAIRTGKYKWAKLGEFLWRKLVPLVGTFSVFQLLGNAAGYEAVGVVAFALLEATLLAELADNLSKMGINMPNSLRKESIEDCDCGCDC